MENSPEQSDHVSAADSEPAEVASPPISPTPTTLPATEGLPAAARFRGMIALAALVFFFNGFGGAFVFDDLRSIKENKTITQLSSLRTVLSPPPNSTVNGRPIINLSLALNYAMGQENVMVYHLTNFAIHLVCALTLFGILRRTMRLDHFSQPVRDSADPLAFAMALLWTVHPLQTESVTYIIQRAESIVAAFFLLTLYSVLRGATSKQSKPWYLMAGICCWLGMASKEVMAFAPLGILVYDWIFLSRKLPQLLQRRGGLYATFFLSWGLLAQLILLGDQRTASVGFDQGISFWEYGMTQCYALTYYLRLAVWPVPLVIDYGRDVVTELTIVIPCGLFIGALLVGTVVALYKRHWSAVLGCLFFGALAPSSSIVPVVTQTMAEHRMYLPLVAVVVLVVALVFHGLQTTFLRATVAGRRPTAFTRALPRALLILATVGLGSQTFLRNFDYLSEKTLWLDNLKHRPDNPRTYYFLAGLFLRGPVEDRNLDEALKYLDRCVELEPEFGLSRRVRGMLYLSRRNYALAIEDLTQAFAHGANKQLALNGRALAYLESGQYAKAIDDYSELWPEAPSTDPGQRNFEAEIARNRGRAWMGLGEFELAVRDLSMSIEVRPNYAETYRNRADAFAELQRPVESERDRATYQRLQRGAQQRRPFN